MVAICNSQLGRSPDHLFLFYLKQIFQLKCWKYFLFLKKYTTILIEMLSTFYDKMKN